MLIFEHIKIEDFVLTFSVSKRREKKTMLNEILKLSVQAKTNKIENEKKMSRVDREISNIYHEIEFEVFNASRGYMLAKQLQEKLKERRIIKNEYGKLFKTYDRLHDLVKILRS
jgi:hypothetical protein